MTSSTYLPILGRELRVAARRRSTFWVRTVAALVFFVIGAGAFVLMRISRMPTSTVGDGLFTVLTWLSFAAALSAGVFFTADSLSEEKREGTLGLLFLTDLRGYDVAGGKLLAAWLRCFYALLAVFPLLAIAMMLGGVTGAQFYKTMLALVNTLFCSLAAGLFVSALSRDSQKALTAAFLLLVILVFGGSSADSLLKASRLSSNPCFALSSPYFAFREAGIWGMNFFWRGLAVSHAVGWVLLAVTCVLVPRTWQERGTRARTARDNWAYTWRYGGPKRRARLRRRLLERSPVTWLCCRERWQGLALWTIALLVVGGTALVAARYGPAALMASAYIAWLILALIYLWAASQACRFFIETRRSGVLELLLVSPVESSVIVRGNWRALLRIFALPVFLIMGAQAVGTFVTQYHMFSLMAGIPATPPPSAIATNANNSSGAVTGALGGAARSGTNQQNYTSTSRQIGQVHYSAAGGTSSNNAAGGTNYSTAYSYSSSNSLSTWNPQAGAVATAYVLIGTATTAANLVAIAWFGLWMGMTSRNSSLATLKTLGCVQVAPLLIIWFITMMLMGLVLFSHLFAGGNGAAKYGISIARWIQLFMAGCVFAFSLAKDIAFSTWARARLRSSFRQAAAQTLGVRPSLPPLPSIPPAPPKTPVPPKIPCPV
jgi:ABC-type transport system involved in cytochrome c biogenesis permease component